MSPIARARSAEYIAKQSASHMGKYPSSETRAKSSVAIKRALADPAVRAKMSAAHKGKWFTVEHKARIAAANIGKRHTPESLAKMSASHKGYVVSPAECAARSAARKGRPVPPGFTRKGRPVSTETRAKIAAAHMGRSLPDHVREKLRIANIGKKHSPESCAKMSRSVTRAFTEGRRAPTCYSTLARSLHEYLRDRCGMVGIEIEVPFGPYRVDLYDPSTQTAFEADGAYWHNRVERERPGYHAMRDEYLSATHGVKVLRFTGEEIGILRRRKAA